MPAASEENLKLCIKLLNDNIALLKKMGRQSKEFLGQIQQFERLKIRIRSGIVFQEETIQTEIQLLNVLNIHLQDIDKKETPADLDEKIKYYDDAYYFFKVKKPLIATREKASRTVDALLVLSNCPALIYKTPRKLASETKTDNALLPQRRK